MRADDGNLLPTGTSVRRTWLRTQPPTFEPARRRSTMGNLLVFRAVNELFKLTD